MDIIIDHTKKFLKTERYPLYLNASEEMKIINQNVRKVVSAYKWNKARLSEIENELNDLIHEIEAVNHSMIEIVTLYKKIKGLRIERRFLKAEQRQLEPFAVWAIENKVINGIDGLNNISIKESRKVNNAVYHPRINLSKNNLIKAGYKRIMKNNNIAVLIPEGFALEREMKNGIKYKHKTQVIK